MGSHSHIAPESRRMRLIALAVVAPLAVLTVVALALLWPASESHAEQEASLPEVLGRIVELDVQECAEEFAGQSWDCGTATVQLTDGQILAGVELGSGPGAPVVAVGDDVVVVVTEYPDGVGYAVVDHQRGTQLWILGLAFVLALLAFGRWRGLTALIGLAVTFAILLFFIVPAILAGESPLLVAIVGSAAIMLTVLYLTHGFTLATTVAVIGTILSFVLTGLLAAVAVGAMHLSGVTDDSDAAVAVIHEIDMQGLLLAGIVIGSLGVLDDVTITQAATVSELARANPRFGARELYAAASRVGRSHIASVVNTIILAYAGASLPLFILIVADAPSISAVVTTQFLAQEIVRSAVATIGLIAAVPITTALAALALRRQGMSPADAA